ncbi:transcription elongation factor GreA [Candidatus Uhrbacteria bacterium CG_4_9_14_3_um_filter_50_9]|uniref:Transcription elongation factor GreA n=1 Tax=Candidatus Uhrbacteria bacterium CG_4_9_14_3_um_filter_50_9 TaxID=1975035 RepID=A0A2M7XEK4_9BACT|nr:MAG: transcription elongation factor GreA [Candidatus Uhrbacteria bacterium CG_4_9_14_3_um_filter_50_9]
MRVPKRKGEEDRRALQPPQDHHLTRDKIAHLKKELEDLEQHERPEAIKEVQRTGEMGDFSENAAYQMAKGRLRRINARILSITERLKYAIPIEEGSPDGVIQIGSRVTVEIDGTERIYHIVGAQEVDVSKGRISYTSPLGKTLVGHRAGESVVFDSPSGEKIYLVKQMT